MISEGTTIKVNLRIGIGMYSLSWGDVGIFPVGGAGFVQSLVLQLVLYRAVLNSAFNIVLQLATSVELKIILITVRLMAAKNWD